MQDVDNNGENDGVQFGCKPEGESTETDSDADGVNDLDDNCPNTVAGDSVDNNGCSQQQLTQPTQDSDGDGIKDSEDECPNTPPETATDTQGCSGEQNQQQSANDSQGNNDSKGLDFMIILIVIGSLILTGALVVLFKKPPEDAFTPDIIDTEPAKKNWEMPVLDGTNQSTENTSTIDMSKFPGWDLEQVEKYLESGWTEQQLEEWYQQQIEQNSA